MIFVGETERLSFMENIGYEVCRSWLGGYHWQEMLPREGSPPPGEKAVKVFAPQLAQPAQTEFVRGWNRCLAECGFLQLTP
jgi:hypothetical protein